MRNLLLKWQISLSVWSMVLSLLMGGCTSPKEKSNPAAAPVVEEKNQQPVPALNTQTTDILYTRIAADSLQDLLRGKDSLPQVVLQYTNRIDRLHLVNLKTLVVPSEFTDDFLRYSPFPSRLEKAAGIDKLILASYPLEAFAFYEQGQLVRWGPVSMGKAATPTPTGLYHTNWKAKHTTSTVDSTWEMNWYFNLDNFEGVSMHEYSLPGHPASHSCIRMLSTDARWVYEHADQWILDDDVHIKAYGTPVVIFGTYKFGEQRPWMYPYANGRVPQLSEQTIDSVLQEHLEQILLRQTARRQHLQDTTTVTAR